MNGLDVTLFCSAGSLLFLASSTTILRCIVRLRMLNAFGADDYLMDAAACCYIPAEGFVFDAVGVTHDKDLAEVIAVLSRAMELMYFGEIFYVLTTWFLKLSTGTFLLRLVQKPIHKHIIQAVLVVVTLYSTAYFFMIVFQCIPVDHFVWKLKMNTAMKVSVSGLLRLGGLVGITTFIRMPYIKSLGESNALDFFAITSRPAIWTCVEPGVGIFVGSLAALRPLFRKFLGGSSIFSRSTPTPNSADRYWHSSRNRERPYPLGNLSKGSKKCVITKVVGGIESRRQGKIFGSDSEEELNDKGYNERGE